MAFKLLIVLLPALVYGNINIQLKGEFDPTNPNNIKVEVSGSSIDVLSDTERTTFKLSDENLKKGAQNYFGKAPDDFYLRSPTPYGDLYQSYGWEQVKRKLVPLGGKVLKITSEPAIVHSSLLENNSSKTSILNAGMSQDVSNTVSSSWSTGGSLTVGASIKYDVTVDVMKTGIKASMSYTSEWGKNNEVSETVTVGTSNTLAVTLEPGEAVMAELIAERGYVEYEVEYDASLTGIMAVNYDDVYKGHHFWALSIAEVMRMAGLENNIKSKQVLKLGFYSTSKVVIRDVKKRTVIKEIRL